MIARRALLLLATLLVAIVAATDSVAQPACTITWDGGASTNSWHDATNWDTDILPGAADHVCIPASTTVEVSQDAGSVLTVQSQGTLSITGGSLSFTDTTESSTTLDLTQSAGILGGTGTLTVSGTYNWTGGDQADAGTTVIASGATLTGSGSTLSIYDGRTLQIDSGATATITDTDVQVGLGGSIENAGTLEFANTNGSEQFIFNGLGGAALLHNTGTFRKSGGDPLRISIPFDNDGTVEVTAGTLFLEGGDTGSTTGDFAGTGVDGLVRFSTDFTLETGVSLSGRIELAGATLTVNGSVPHTTGTFTQSAGILGGTGTLTVSGTYNWTGGDQADAGTTVIASGATLTGSGSTLSIYDGRTLQIDSGATATITDTDVQVGLGGSIENAGTLEFANTNGSEQFIFNGLGGAALLHNTGTFRKSGGDPLRISIPFDNDGTVEVTAGTLRLEGGDSGTSGGTFTAAAGASLLLDAGTFTLGTSSSLSGAGTVGVGGGTVDFSGSYDLTGTLLLSGGTLTANSSGTIPSLTQSAGILGGTGTLTVSGTYNWTGGDQADAGTTVIASGATLTGSGSTLSIYDGRTLQIDSGATATITDTDVQVGLGGSIENAGTLEFANTNGSEQFIFNGLGGAALLHNTGTFRKSGGDPLRISIPFDNDGTVEVTAGTLFLEGGDTGSTTGDFAGTGVDGLVRFSTDFTLETGVSLSGRIELAGATLTVNGSVPHTTGTFTQSAGILGGTGTLTVSGTYNWTGGDQADAGTTVIASGATLTGSGSTLSIYDGRTLQIDSGATATITDTDVQVGLGGSIENAGTLEFANTNGSEQFIFNGLGGAALLHNTGTFRKSGGDPLRISIPFDNDGTVEVVTGIMSAEASYTQDAGGTLHVHIGGLTPGTGFSQLNVTGGATIAGTLRITTESGFQPALGQSFRIINADSLSGTFTSLEGSNIGGGLAYTDQYDGTGVTLVVGETAFPQVSIDDVSVFEGDTGTTNATFTVSLSIASTDTVTVSFATADDTATAPADYTTTSDTLTFAPGVTTQTITVPVVGDTLDEPDETFFVNLTGSSPNSFISDAQGLGTILDDGDGLAPNATIDDVSVTEGDTGTTNATFTVTLASTATGTATVDFQTANNSATAPADYTAQSGQLVFNQGVLTQTITVPVAGDVLDEPNETFFVNLTGSSPNVAIADSQGQGTIIDNDPTPDTTVDATIDDVSVTEGDTGTTNATFTVTLASAATGTATVTFATADGTATQPGDYTSQSGTLTFAEGVTTQTITVPVVGDTADEPNETFFVDLTGSSPNVSVADPQGQGTIIDNDPTPDTTVDATIDDVSVTEGDTGTTNATFTVTLASAATGTATVTFASADGTATAPSDYTTTSGTLTFTQGVLTQTITVPVVGDTIDEPNESFFVNLTGSSTNVTLTDSQGRGTILDDDEPPPTPARVTLSPASATNDVGTEHCVAATVTDGSSNTMSGVTVRFSVSGPNATSGSDTTTANGEARFCYTGTNPGDDTIRAFADADGNGTQDTGEPSVEATKRWVEEPPVGVPGCEVEGKGWIRTANGDKASFRIDVESGPQPEGRVSFKVHGPGQRFEFKSKPVTQVLVTNDGRAATIIGQARIKGGAVVEFRVDVQDLPRLPDTFRIRLSNGYDSGERTIHGGGADIECKCEAKGAGEIKAANGDQARFSVDVNSLPAMGSLYFKDRGPAQPFELRSIEITQVTIGPGTTQATILGKAKINGAGPFDFRVDAADVPRAPDSFRIRVNEYDSGEQQILAGDLDVDCGDGDHDGGDDKKDDKEKDKKGKK